jgi:hypothetical protein
MIKELKEKIKAANEKYKDVYITVDENMNGANKILMVKENYHCSIDENTPFDKLDEAFERMYADCQKNWNKGVS